MAKFFINRPIVAMVIAILMVIIGLVAMSGLPIAQFPNIVPPEIQVKTTYTGADGTKKLRERLKESFPEDLDYAIALDTTLAVTEGMKEIKHTLIEALVLVILVVFLFLQGWRATFYVVEKLSHRDVKHEPAVRDEPITHVSHDSGGGH